MVVRGGRVLVDVLVGVGLDEVERVLEDVLDDGVLEDELDDRLELDELDVDELDDRLDVDELDVEVELSSTGRSSTGGGSVGDAATRNPRKTSNGTQRAAARTSPSRLARRRFTTAPHPCSEV